MAEVRRPPQITSSCPGSRVWILDDDEGLCKLIERQFAQNSWQTLSFHRCSELEAMLKESIPHLLVLDQMLPDGTGTQFLSNIRLRGHDFPVLMLSALGSPDDRIEGLEVGADDYLSKPFTGRELILRIERLLRARQPVSKAADATPFVFPAEKLVFNPSSGVLEVEGNSIQLSRGDSLLLTRFCQAPGLLLSREQLASGSGSIVDPASSRSLDMRISKLRRQLNELIPGMGTQIESVRGRGYRLKILVEQADASTPTSESE